jgi:hypothetical protein
VSSILNILSFLFSVPPSLFGIDSNAATESTSSSLSSSSSSTISLDLQAPCAATAHGFYTRDHLPASWLALLEEEPITRFAFAADPHALYPLYFETIERPMFVDQIMVRPRILI